MQLNFRSVNDPKAIYFEIIKAANPSLKAILLSSTAWTGGTRLAISGLVSGLALAPLSGAWALPVGGTVAAGAASIAGTKNAVTITQSSQDAVINWQGFSIGQNEAVTFKQPNSSSAALNRVVGADPSTILGRLSANGQVFIINPNGVLFAKGAQVNVGGLVASTLDITDGNFIANNDQFAGSSSRGVVNKGAISANGGYVALLGAKVSNQGVITARLGTVALAAGSAVTLDVAGDGLLNVAVDQAAVNALAKNGGLIKANGGQVVMTATSAGQLLKTVVNNSGVIEAQSIDSHNGSIKLLGDTASGIVAVSGTLDASGARAGQTGGNIVVTGNTVVLRGHARITASGAAGGGSVQIGGSAGQTGSVPLAGKVAMGANVVISADALSTGNGGSVVLRSAGVTQGLGTITARGGAVSGNGGTVETSGQQVVTGVTTKVNTLAPEGKTGNWLLDPIDYTIAIVGGDETPASVAFSLATSNRTISATNDITVASPVSWSTPQTLTLNAGSLVTVNAAMTASTSGAGIVITGGQGVVINAPLTASGIGNLIQLNATTGDLNVNAAITASASGALVQLNAGHDVDINAATGLTPGGVVSASGGGAITLISDTMGVPGPTGGTVNICSSCAVTSTSVTIYYSPPNGYGSPTAYTGFTAYEWVFVEANNKVYDGTTAATARFYADPTVGGTILVGLTGGTMSFVDKNVGVAKNVTYSNYSIDGAGAGAYALFSGSGITTASITPAPLTVTANSTSKTYGQTASLSPTAFTASGLQGGDTIAGVSETSLGSAATAAVTGGPYAITASNAVGGSYVSTNYTTIYVPGSLAVTPAPLTITANNAVKTYGQLVTFGPLAFTSTGLQNGDTIAGVTEASLGSVGTAPVVGSPYAITPSNAVGGSYVSSNYTTIYLPGHLAITPAALVITADSLVKTYGQAASLSPSAFTASGLQNGETVGSVTEASAGAAATAPVAGNPYAVTASNATGGSFNPSNYSTAYDQGALVVTPASLAITADSVSKISGQAISFPATAFTANGLQNGDSISGVTETSPGAGASAGASGSPYPITPSNAVGSNFDPGNYSTSYIGGALLVTVPVVTPPVVTPPVVTPPVVMPPVVTPPVVTSPVVITPVGTQPVAQAPAAGAPAAGAPAGGTPAGGTPAGGTPAGGTPASGTPAGGTPVVQTPIVQVPVLQTPIETMQGATPIIETAQTGATPAETQPVSLSPQAMGGDTGAAVVASAGLTLVVVDQGVRMPAVVPAEAIPADTAAGEYPRKPDRN